MKDFLLYWYFVNENRDLYEKWKVDFLADPPPEFADRARTSRVAKSATDALGVEIISGTDFMKEITPP